MIRNFNGKDIEEVIRLWNEVTPHSIIDNRTFVKNILLDPNYDERGFFLYEYEGEIVNDSPQGIGTMRFANNDVYEGEWNVGCMHGKGTYRFYDPNTDRFAGSYCGQFVNNKFEGIGTRIYADKIIYKGSWQNNMRTGNGAIWLTNGSYFYGIWKFDKMIRGVFHLASGDIYDGEMSNDKFEGFGKYFWNEDNSFFEGVFKDG